MKASNLFYFIICLILENAARVIGHCISLVVSTKPNLFYLVLDEANEHAYAFI